MPEAIFKRRAKKEGGGQTLLRIGSCGNRLGAPTTDPKRPGKDIGIRRAVSGHRQFHEFPHLSLCAFLWPLLPVIGARPGSHRSGKLDDPMLFLIMPYATGVYESAREMNRYTIRNIMCATRSSICSVG